jgi:hypothetical protein
VLNGAGSSGELSGLLGLAGTTATTATGTTAAANVAQIGHNYMDVSAAAGRAPTLLLMHPRRASYIRTMLGYAPAPWPTPGQPLEVPGMPTNIGGTQDAVIEIAIDDVILFPGRPSFRVMADVLSGTLTVRCSAFAYAAMVVRTPAAVGKITGAGLATPVFTA